MCFPITNGPLDTNTPYALKLKPHEHTLHPKPHEYTLNPTPGQVREGYLALLEVEHTRNLHSPAQCSQQAKRVRGV